MSKMKTSKKAFHLECVEVYKTLYSQHLHYRPKLESYKRVYKMLNAFLDEGYTRNQVVALIFCHFEWRGPEGTSEWGYKGLRDSNFPFVWIDSRSPAYTKYIQDTIGVENWNNPKFMEKLIFTWELKLFGQ